MMKDGRGEKNGRCQKEQKGKETRRLKYKGREMNARQKETIGENGIREEEEMLTLILLTLRIG
jgi:hypothetical protein